MLAIYETVKVYLITLKSFLAIHLIFHFKIRYLLLYYRNDHDFLSKYLLSL